VTALPPTHRTHSRTDPCNPCNTHCLAAGRAWSHSRPPHTPHPPAHNHLPALCRRLSVLAPTLLCRSEDQAIVNAVREFGPRWCSVATCLPQRTEQAVRNRWNRLQQRARVQARALSLRRAAAGCGGPPPAMEKLEQQQQAACV